MALTYGFYNSQNGDRVYDADQFSSFLDGIVYDGVYEAVGDKFYVTSLEDEDLTIQVGAGRAWLKHTWTLNDTNLYLNATAALDVYDRIDAVVLEVDKEIRTNSIKIIEGTPSDATPARPDLKNEDNIRQYPLAYIYREHGTTTIPNTHAGTLETDTESATECIKFMVGSSSMPLCSALALAGIPSGGKIGQVLAKKSSESAAVDWYDWYGLPTDGWYLVNGITEENVIAAWRFKGAASKEDALTNDNSGGELYILGASENVQWSAAKGLYFPSKANEYINNTEFLSKYANSIITVVFGYSDLKTGSYASGGPTLIKAGNISLLAKGANSASSIYYNSSINTKVASTTHTDGVLAGDFSNVKLFYNGVSQSLIEKSGSHTTVPSRETDWVYPRVFTNPKNASWNISYIYVTALIFYNCTLTDSQHIEIANKVKTL
jgi:hypothetical protein